MTEAKNTDAKPKDLPEPKPLDYIFMEEESEEVDFNKLASDEDLDPELKTFLENLNNNEDLDKAVDTLLEDIDLEGNIDIEEIKNKIFLLLRDYLARIKSLDEAHVKKILKKREKAIYKHLEQLSHYLIVRRAQTKENQKTIFDQIKDSISGITRQSRIDFRNVVKRFAIYEIYKIINPKRIAGETKIINFVDNMIMGGFNKAHKYEGGKDSDILHYTQNQINKAAQNINYKKPIKLRTLQNLIHQRQKSRGWER